MRDCHPDFSNAEEAHEFATFLNEIYEVRRLFTSLQDMFLSGQSPKADPETDFKPCRH